jgi:hypothetical protein
MSVMTIARETRGVRPVRLVSQVTAEPRQSTRYEEAPDRGDRNVEAPETYRGGAEAPDAGEAHRDWDSDYTHGRSQS